MYVRMYVSAARTDGAAKMECSQCTHGARCVSSSQPSEEEQGNSVLLTDSQDMEDGEPQPTIDCNCQHYKCTGLASRTLCATNGVTYINECHMRREACLQQKDIFKLHDGHCRHNCKLVVIASLSFSHPTLSSVSLLSSLYSCTYMRTPNKALEVCYLCTLCENA